MVIERRPKTRGHGRTYTKVNKKLPINFDLSSLTLMCNYVISENRNIRRLQYVNLRNLIDMLDMEKYINDPERYKRIIFIQKGLEARLERGISDPILLYKYINGGIIDDDIIDISSFSSLSNNEIDWINETVSSTIKSAFIYEECDRMIDLWTRFRSADYTSISAISAEIEQATAQLHTKFRKAKVESNTEQMFSLAPDNLHAVLMDTWEETTSKYRKLITGMQGFNQLIGGGFENTRVYLLLGITGVGKSMTLMNIAYQIKKYNKGFKPKDPTKRPCVLYLTMENTVTESLQRLFQICTGEELAKQSSPEEAERKLRTEGELYLTDSSPIDILIKFKPNKSEDTSYLYTLVEDLEDEGYEVICLLQDHAKRIRSTTNNPDIRLELGDVINEFKTFAMLKDIPVISNSHLNREGARVIDANATSSKSDLTRLLGKSNIGESLLMLDNVDFAAIINNEYDREGNKYMVFKQVKTRIKSFRDYICQPFDKENEIKLVEDYYSPLPVFKETLYSDPVLNTGIKKSKSATVQENIRDYGIDLPIIDDDENDNIYNTDSQYSSSSYSILDGESTLIKPFTIQLDMTKVL